MNPTFKKIFLGLATFLMISACGESTNNSPDSANVANNETNPSPNPYPTFQSRANLRGTNETNFAVLINSYLQSKIEPTPWAGYWWPYTKNGIAEPTAGGASPAGRYDAARGGTTHAQQWEILHHGARVPRVQSWWGHCNGWTAASALFPEPHEPIVVNGIPFGIGDIKGLLTEAGMAANADFYGERIDVDDPNNPKYWDTIPNQYFLVLTNYIGKQKKPVLIDRYTGSQIWNQPLAGYRMEYPKPSDYLGNSPEAPNIYKIMVTSTLWWLDDGVPPDVQTPPFDFENSDPAIYQSRELRMEVWVDAPVIFDTNGRIQSSGNVVIARDDNNNLVGGAWRMGGGFMVDAWPDYMWIPYSISKPTDPDEDYANPEVDIEWIKAHLLVQGGLDDPSVTPSPLPSAPPAPRPSFPWPFSSSTPGGPLPDWPAPHPTN